MLRLYCRILHMYCDHIQAASEIAVCTQEANTRRATNLLADLLEWNLEENLTQKSFTALCEILVHNLDELRETHFPTTFARAMHAFEDFDTPFHRADMCVNGCCFYEKELAGADHCPKCKECRWQSFEKDDTSRKPRLQFLWWPLKDIFRRLFHSPEIAELLRAHGRHTSPETGRKDTIWGKSSAQCPNVYDDICNMYAICFQTVANMSRTC